MQSRFHHMVTVGLSIGLGAALSLVFSAQDAAGYPAGAAISAGSNPVVSVGGSREFEWDTPASVEVMTAPADQDIVLTDVILNLSSGHIACGEVARASLTTPSTGTIGEFSVMSPLVYFNGSETAFLSPSPPMRSMVSGLRIPAGETLTLTVTHEGWGGSYCTTGYTQELRYTLSGYHAQP